MMFLPGSGGGFCQARRRFLPGLEEIPARPGRGSCQARRRFLPSLEEVLARLGGCSCQAKRRFLPGLEEVPARPGGGLLALIGPLSPSLSHRREFTGILYIDITAVRELWGQTELLSPVSIFNIKTDHRKFNS